MLLLLLCSHNRVADETRDAVYATCLSDRLNTGDTHQECLAVVGNRCLWLHQELGVI